MLPSRSEPDSLPIIYAEYRLWKPILLRMTAATRETDPTDFRYCDWLSIGVVGDFEAVIVRVLLGEEVGWE